MAEGQNTCSTQAHLRARSPSIQQFCGFDSIQCRESGGGITSRHNARFPTLHILVLHALLGVEAEFQEIHRGEVGSVKGDVLPDLRFLESCDGVGSNFK